MIEPGVTWTMRCDGIHPDIAFDLDRPGTPVPAPCSSSLSLTLTAGSPQAAIAVRTDDGWVDARVETVHLDEDHDGYWLADRVTDKLERVARDALYVSAGLCGWTIVPGTSEGADDEHVCPTCSSYMPQPPEIVAGSDQAG